MIYYHFVFKFQITEISELKPTTKVLDLGGNPISSIGTIPREILDVNLSNTKLKTKQEIKGNAVDLGMTPNVVGIAPTLSLAYTKLKKVPEYLRDKQFEGNN